jgi:hypothetical protein
MVPTRQSKRGLRAPCCLHEANEFCREPSAGAVSLGEGELWLEDLALVEIGERGSRARPQVRVAMLG